MIFSVRVSNKYIGDIFPVFDNEGRMLEICLEKPLEYEERSLPEGAEAVCDYLASYPDGKSPVGFDFFILDDRSDFYKEVYRNLFALEKGEVITYAGLAEKSGSKRAARAVGSAMASNPYPLLIPCHRVVKSDGLLGNYSSGVHKKEKLLLAENLKIEKGKVKK